jgi:general secretion pathway protein C
MKARLTAFVIWAAVAASAMFWILRLGASSPAAPSHTVAVSAAATPRGDLTRVFGAAPVRSQSGADGSVQTPLSSRFKLLGVAAPRQGGDRVGLALIAVDGKPARGYVVGAAVDGDLLLQSVHARGAKLGARDAAPQVTLELPPLIPAATGILPAAPPLGAAAGLPAPFAGATPQLPVGASSADLQQSEPIPVPPPPGVNTR